MSQRANDRQAKRSEPFSSSKAIRNLLGNSPGYWMLHWPQCCGLVRGHKNNPGQGMIQSGLKIKTHPRTHNAQLLTNAQDLYNRV